MELSGKELVRTWPELVVNEFFPSSEFAKFLGNYIGGLEVLDFSGIEQVTDEVFFILNREGIAGNIKEIVCTGCVHITDFGISLLVKACPNLEQVTLDGCRQVGTPSLQYLISGCDNLRCLSMRATQVTYLPADLSTKLIINLEGCPLLHPIPLTSDRTASANLVANLQRQKLVILAKDEVATSVLGFLMTGTFDETAAHSRTYKKDVTIPNINDVRFNVFECHSTRTSYLPFMSQSDQASYVFAFDVKLAGKHALQHVMSMLNVINGQGLHAPVFILGLHTGDSAEESMLYELGSQIENCMQQHTNLLEEHLQNEAYFNDKLEERDFLTQVRQMRGRDHFSRRSVYSVTMVNTLTSEVQFVWPKYLDASTDSEEAKMAAENRGQAVDYSFDSGLQQDDILKELIKVTEEAENFMEAITKKWAKAHDALNSITKASMSEIKSMSRPPVLLKQVLGCMVKLLGSKDDSWPAVKIQLSDSLLISKLRNFDKDSVKPSTMEHIQKFIDDESITVEKAMRISSFAAAVWSWVEGIHAYVVALPRLNAFRMTKANLENKLMKLKTNPGIFGMGPALVQAMLKKSILAVETTQPEGSNFCSDFLVAVLTILREMTDQCLVPLEEVVARIKESSAIDHSIYGPPSVKKAIERLHIMGELLFYPDAPSQPVVTDVSWFMSVTQGIESLNKVEEVWNKQRVEGLGPDEAVFAQSQFIQHWKGDATDAQVDSVFAILLELGILVRLPVQQMTDSGCEEPQYFLFSCVNEKTWLPRSLTEGIWTNYKFFSLYWPEDPGPDTVCVRYRYKFNYGMPLSLLPRVINESLMMGTVLKIWQWGFIVQQGAAEILIRHNVQAIQRCSSLDLELRTMAASPVHILQQYIWSILSNYLLIIDYQAHRFPHLAVQVMVQCRGQCSSLGAPHTFGDYELKKALGYIPPCPKCSDDSISLENTGYMIGRQHFLPFHRFVDPYSQQCSNPHSQYSRVGDVAHLKETTEAMWKCQVCGVTGHQISEMETSLYPSFVSSILDQPVTDTSETPQLELYGNIVQLVGHQSHNKSIAPGSGGRVVAFAHPLLFNGFTRISVTILSQGSVTVLLGKDSNLQGCASVTDPETCDLNLWYELDKGLMYHSNVSKREKCNIKVSQCTFGVGDTLTVVSVGHEERGRAEDVGYVVTVTKFFKNGMEFASLDLPFRNFIGILLKSDADGNLPKIILNCPTYAVVRAHHFQLGSALLYMSSVSHHWTLGKILAIQNGLLTVGEDVAHPEEKSFQADSDLIVPLNINQDSMMVIVGKEPKHNQDQVADWLLTHQSWPALPALFSIYHRNKSQIVYCTLRKLGLSTSACTANPHSPQVLHTAMMRHNQTGKKEVTYTPAENCVLLPQQLDMEVLLNPHRHLIHQWSSQSIHLVCTAQALRGIGELELISDAHFMGVAPIDVDPANISFFQTRFLDALISNYASLTSLKNFFVPYGEGLGVLSDIPVVERGLRQIMKVYLATCVLLKRLDSPFLVPHKQDQDARKYIMKVKKDLQAKLEEPMSGNMCATHKLLTKNDRFSKANFQPNDITYARNVHHVSADRSPKFEVLELLCETLPNLHIISLSSCKLVQLEGISSCSQLTSLNLMSNNFTRIPDQLLALSRTLAVLNLVDNPLDGLPDFLTKLINLVELHLSAVRELPENFGALRKLKILHLSDSTLTRLPNSFRRLHRLEVLHLAGIPWPSIPLGKDYTESSFEAWLNKQSSSIDKAAMKALFIKHNTNQDKILKADDILGFLQALSKAFPRLGENDSEPITGGIPEQLFSCLHLHQLSLPYQAIRFVPDMIENLKQMTVLDIGKSLTLESVSSHVGKLPRLRYFKVSSWPNLRTPPPEIVAQGNASLIAYLRRLSQGSVACFRTKLMFVGLGGAGKTSLMRALMSVDGKSRVIQGEGITDGIDISTWNINTVHQKVTFSVWDFAGQTVYYNTHQFFLSKRAVYMLVWNTRLGFEHSGLEFWLSSIACHTPKAPIFVVGTHADQITNTDIPSERLKERFPNIVGFCSISSHTGQGIEDLKTRLMEATLKQPYIGENVPEAWLDLEKAILGKRSNRSLLLWNEVGRLAQKCAITGPEIRRAVLFLHELGTLQYFDSELLRDRVVINPQWIVDVMACVVSVHNTVIENGHLAHDKISVIWKEYPAELHPWLLRLTEVFDLTFPLADSHENIVPCLLPQTEPKYEWIQTDGENTEMKMVYKFDYLPAGLFNRAQVRLCQFSENAAMWKHGSVLKKNLHMAVIKQTSETEVLVRVVGARPENIVLLIHEVFEGLIADFFQGVKYEYQLPCIDCIRSESIKDPWMFSSRMMTRALQMKALFLQCHNFFHTLSVSDIQAVMPPTSNTDYTLQMETAMQQLDGLEHDLASDVFFVYCEKDLPQEIASDRAVHPSRIKDDLAKVGIKSWFEERLSTRKVEDLTIAMKNCKIVLVMISNDFVEDELCQRVFHFVHDIMRKEILLLMVGSGREWQQSEIGMQVADKVYMNFQRLEQYGDKMEKLAEQLREKLGKQESQKESSCDVFLSYCWSNSETSVMEGLAKAKEGSLGAGDPRKMKSFLEDSGLQVWLDLEKTGKNGLFSDIAEGMKKAKVVVACISDEYVLSRNCQMEFRFAHIALHLPLVLAVVGTGFQYESTEIGMLSLGYPKVNFQVANNMAHRQLLEHVQEAISRVKLDDNIERPFSPIQTSHKEMAFLELYEMAQRKFLRQVSSYLNEDTLYPRLFVVDLNYDPSSSSQENRREVDVGELDIEVENDDPSSKPAPVNLDSGMFCIKTLCEHEGGWHAVTDGVEFGLSGSELRLLWQLAAPYMARILAILKHSNINLHIIRQDEGAKIMKILQEKAVIHPQFDLRPLYLRLRQYVIMKDTAKTRGGLSRCYLPSGKVLWLCEEHQHQPRITVLSATDDSDWSEILSEHQIPEAWLLAELTEVARKAGYLEGSVAADSKEGESAAGSVRPVIGSTTALSPPPLALSVGTPSNAKGSDAHTESAHSHHMNPSENVREVRETKDKAQSVPTRRREKVVKAPRSSSKNSDQGHPTTKEDRFNVAGEIAAGTKMAVKSQACIVL